MTLTSDQLADSDRDGFLVVRNAVDDERLATEVGADTWYTDVATLTLEDADRVIELAEAKDVDLRVGYSMQYAQRYAVGHEEISQKKIGGLARCYDTQAVAAAILKRSPTATPVMDILTYLVDFIGWCHPHARPIEVTVGTPCNITTAREARTTLAVTLAIDQSANTGRTIILEDA